MLFLIMLYVHIETGHAAPRQPSARKEG
jgi:hypothetical protein